TRAPLRLAGHGTGRRGLGRQDPEETAYGSGGSVYFGIEGSFGSKGVGFQSIVGMWVGAGGGLGPRWGFCGTCDGRAVLRCGAGADPRLGEGFGSAGGGETEAEGPEAADCEGVGEGGAVAASALAVGVMPGFSAGGAAPPAPPEQPLSSRPPTSITVTAPGTLPLELTPTTPRFLRCPPVRRGRS
ncbi:hypothetical protein ACWGIF_10990, partial [Streptomyces sp. NPDC054849]